MLNTNFAILGAILPFLGSVSYARDTLRGDTKPNRVSWFLWTIAPLVAFAAELVQHVSFRTALLTFAVGFGPFVVVLASFANRKAYWKLTRFDMACGAFSIIALILWLITGKGNVAIVFSILSDCLAAVPTIVKAYKAPETESALAFVLSVAGAVITLLTVKQWVFANYAFTLYIALISFIIAGFASRGKSRQLKTEPE